jgi:hypothetical protein
MRCGRSAQKPDIELRDGSDPVEFSASQTRFCDVLPVCFQSLGITFRPSTILKLIQQAGEQLFYVGWKIDLLLVRLKTIQ